jgi:large subunit ribosomal protein L15
VVKSARKPIKILGSGEINHPLTVKAHKFSAVARKKIEIAGGKTEEIGSASEAS